MHLGEFTCTQRLVTWLWRLYSLIRSVDPLFILWFSQLDFLIEWIGFHDSSSLPLFPALLSEQLISFMIKLPSNGVSMRPGPTLMSPTSNGTSIGTGKLEANYQVQCVMFNVAACSLDVRTNQLSSVQSTHRPKISLSQTRTMPKRKQKRRTIPRSTSIQPKRPDTCSS